MSGKNLTLALQLTADARRLSGELSRGQREVSKFTAGVKREFQALKGMADGVVGTFAKIGVSVGAMNELVQSARTDKMLTRIGQTAGESIGQVEGLRGELFRMARDTGRDTEDLREGFDIAVQQGLGFKAALPVLGAVNKGMAVTGASAEQLTGALGVASTAFQFDLEKPGEALLLLDKMTVAGRKGNAELESLSSIFARVAGNASLANFSFDKTLAFIEGLSQVERQPERLATLAESTIRLFTNQNYLEDAAKATGVRFFDAKTRNRRDPIAVLEDIRKKFRTLKTDLGRSKFLDDAFGKTDLDTKRGLITLFSGSTLEQVKEFTRDIGGASGTIERDLPAAISNAVDQAGRLKAVMREAADEFARPVNEVFANSVKTLLDSKKNGGMELSGKELLGYGAGGLAGSLLLARYLPKGFAALTKGLGGTAAGVATGKALEAATGVTPVFVTNWPGATLPGLPAAGTGAAAGADKVGGIVSKARNALNNAPLIKNTVLGMNVGQLAKGGALGLGVTGGMIAGAFAVGHGAGSLLYENKLAGTEFADKVGEGVARVLALFGNEDARRAIETTEKFRAAGAELADKISSTDLGGTLNIRIDSTAPARVTGMNTNAPGMRMNVDTGPVMVAPQ
jgi:TP901 family phage tail tape measure protein